MPTERVVVVGTTSDYIDLIRKRYPGRTLFITDTSERARASEEAPAPCDEVLCSLRDASAALASLRSHLQTYGLTAAGVAGFDCESLGLAAELARALGLPFPTLSSVSLCRNKFLSKEAWHAAGVDCPRAGIVRSASEACSFLADLGRPVILKPLTGSGGELVFRCAEQADCVSALEIMHRRLAELGASRMYTPGQAGSAGFDPLQEVVIEELVGGHEYSCDFLLAEGRLEIIRMAEKVPAAGAHAGTTAAYILPAVLPEEVPGFQEQLRRAAAALGLERAICMVDFLVWQGRAYLLELTPRPGGDCLPWLIRQCSGLDMLGLALDFAQGREVRLPEPSDWQRLVGLRLFAGRAGVVRHIDDRALRQDGRVREVLIKRQPGHRVVMPPQDYDSRLLGHVVFQPSPEIPVEEQCVDLSGKLTVTIEAT